MSLHCYHCTAEPLLPTKLDDTLPALSCKKCQGIYLDLLTYRSWLESHAAHKTSDDSETGESDKQSSKTFDASELKNTDNALVCQRCRKFMLKYRINNEHKNTINVCHTCDDVWLDRGEWPLLKYLKMQDKLTAVMSEPWQQQLRNQDREQAFNKLYQQKLGNDFEAVERFALWLQNHPQKSEIQHYLSQYRSVSNK